MFLIYEFSYEKCSEIFLKMLSLYSVGQKKSCKVPATFPTNFPAKNLKEFTDELLQKRRENKSLFDHIVLLAVSVAQKSKLSQFLRDNSPNLFMFLCFSFPEEEVWSRKGFLTFRQSWNHFRCAMEPSPGHIQCQVYARNSLTLYHRKGPNKVPLDAIG